jgi:hypothetical protein
MAVAGAAEVAIPNDDAVGGRERVVQGAEIRRTAKAVFVDGELVELRRLREGRGEEDGKGE